MTDKTTTSASSLFGEFDKIQREPWKDAYGYHEQRLEWERARQFLVRLEEVLDQERLVLKRVQQTESRTTGEDKRPVQYFRKEHVKLTLEIEWDEWHPILEQTEDDR